MKITTAEDLSRITGQPLEYCERIIKEQYFNLIVNMCRVFQGQVQKELYEKTEQELEEIASALKFIFKINIYNDGLMSFNENLFTNSFLNDKT